jgi:NAD(P)-dependent dehydrogenase (short-subunit alcohol dehydrogenase family)
MNISLAGKRALVTGGSSGIGFAIAKAMLAAGAKVGINYLNHPKDVKNAASEAAIQREAVLIRGDVAKAASVAKLFKQLDSRWGGVDILVNNAGIDGKRALSWEADPDEWRKVIEVNLFGALNCSREALKRMVRQKSGVILNISSVHEEIAWSGYSAYACSKAAVGMLTKTLAQEAAPFGVRVISLAPGAIKTPINQAVWSSPKGLKDLLAKIPLKRIGNPEDVANMAVMLASDASSYVTGRTVFVDGGMTDYPDFAHGG